MPTPTAAGQRFYSQVAPIMGADPSQAGLALCDAAGAMLQGLDEITQDTPTYVGWAPAVDPDLARASWLPWTASIYGVTLAPGLTVQQQRDTIRDLPPQRDGRTQTIHDAVAQTLTGSKYVDVVERPDDDAYRIEVVTTTVQTPDAAKTAAAALAAKPGGLHMDVYVSDDVLIDEGTATIDSVDTAVTIDGAVRSDVVT